MDNPLRSLDWSKVQAFVAVAETGSLSGAARRLDMSQPTLGRQIKAMEAEMSVVLFTRQPRGLELTEAGSALLGPAQAMQEAANQMTLLAAGRSETIAGTVRVTASVTMSVHMMPKVIASLRRQEPEIQIELVATDTVDNLLFREADIAVRLYRPEQLDLVAKHIGEMPLGLFCSRAYLGNRKVPETIDDLLTHDIIGYDTEERIIRGLRAFGYDVDRTAFSTRCDNHNAIAAMVSAGCGIGFVPNAVATPDPELIQVGRELPVPPLPVWLTAHEAMRQTPRIRRVWDILAAELPALLDAPEPRG